MNRLEMPANLELMDTNSPNILKFSQITSLDTFDGLHSNNFHPQGLYSAEIFGRVGSPERDTRFATIATKLPLIHPFIFKKICKLRGLYGEIISGKGYAVWNAKEKDFEPSDIISGQTGFYFFMSYLNKIEFKVTDSEKRKQSVALINKAIKDKTIYVTHVPVIPAGLRDAYIESDGRVTEDDINPFYRAILSATNALPERLSKLSIQEALKGEGSTDISIYNTTRVSMQNALNNLFDYLWNLYSGKGGFAQRRYYSRGVFNGTRNVVSAMNSAVEELGLPHSPKSNNTVVGLFQCMKMLLPVAQHLILNGLASQVFSADGRAYLVNAKTLKNELVTVDRKTYDYFNTPDGVLKSINAFFNRDRRVKPVVVKEGYYMGLVYRGEYKGKKVFKFLRDIDELPEKFDVKDVHPITWVEYFYIQGYDKWNLFPMMNTRYPVAGLGSTYMSNVYVKTTVVGEQRWELNDTWDGYAERGEIKYAYEYPDFTSTGFVETASFATGRLAGLAADNRLFD